MTASPLTKQDITSATDEDFCTFNAVKIEKIISALQLLREKLLCQCKLLSDVLEYQKKCDKKCDTCEKIDDCFQLEEKDGWNQKTI